jgi:hypothetical protein
MSGEAGARIEGELFCIFVGCGFNEDVRVPEGDDGSAITNHFDAASAPYDRWLARAAADLGALFADARTSGPLPLVPRRQPLEQIDGTIIDDGDDRSDDRARHFAEYHRGGPLSISVRSHTLLPRWQSLSVAIAVAGRVRRGDLDALLARVAAVLLAHAADPPPPSRDPEPIPEPEPDGLAARLRRRFGH